MTNGHTSFGNELAVVRAVILDYGEVLCFRPKPDVLLRMAEVFRTKPSRFFDLYVSSRGPYDQGLLPAHTYWQNFARDQGVHINASLIDDLRRWDTDMWSCINPVMTHWLQTLSGALTTALLSNMQHDMAAHARKNFAWLSLFHHQFLSCELGLIKPDPAIFHECVRCLGVTPGEILFVDDRPANVDAARSIGMKAIQFKSVVQLRADLHKRGFQILPALPAGETNIPARKNSGER